jgi:beta-glucanase (GH16 family)
MNGWTGGRFQQAISGRGYPLCSGVGLWLAGVTMLNNNWYDGIQVRSSIPPHCGGPWLIELQYQKYAFEYIPGKENGAIAWFVGDDETFRMSGKAIGPNGNVGQRDVSREPMSIILNLGISTGWTWIDWDKLGPTLAAGTTMYIDYVRIYQKEGQQLITCDPRMSLDIPLLNYGLF